MLDQLARVARVEDAVEELTATQIDRFLELLAEDAVVGDHGVVQRERRHVDVRRRPPGPEGNRRERRRRQERHEAPVPCPPAARYMLG